MILFSIVSFLAGCGIAAYFGWEAFRGWAWGLDTTSEWHDFILCLAAVFVGISIVTTSIR